MESSNTSASERVRRLQEERDRLLLQGQMQTIVAPEIDKEFIAPGTRTWQQAQAEAAQTGRSVNPNDMTVKQRDYLYNLSRAVGLPVSWMKNLSLTKSQASKAIEILVDVKKEVPDPAISPRQKARIRLERAGLI